MKADSEIRFTPAGADEWEWIVKQLMRICKVKFEAEQHTAMDHQNRMHTTKVLKLLSESGLLLRKETF